MNQVAVSGTLVQKPDLRYTPKGIAVLRLRIGGAVADEDATRSHYLDVTLFGDKAARLADVLDVGATILAMGELTQRQAEGKTYTNLVARSIRAVLSPKVQDGLEQGAVNRFTGIGFLVDDPEVRVEGRLVRARVAFNSRDKNGETHTVFLNVDAWEEVGQELRRLKKGAQVYVEGLVRARAYTAKDGSKRRDVFISARVVRPLTWASGQSEEVRVVEATVNEDSGSWLSEDEFPEDLPF